MTWYYSINSERLGPVDQAAFDQLLSRGEVKPDTLVWREGMENWATYAAAHSAPLSPAPSVVPTMASPAGPSCSRCGSSLGANELVQINGRSICAPCKPLEVQTLREGAPATSDSEQIRREHINHEVCFKFFGFLHALGGIGCLALGLGAIAGFFASSEPGGILASRAGGALLMFLGGFQLWVGLGLRRLLASARTGAILLSVLGLLNFPLGTLINLYVLYLLLSKKGGKVFSADYKRILEETRQFKYRTPIFLWIVIGVIVILAAVALSTAIR